MSAEESMKATLDSFEERLGKLENPDSQEQHNPDPDKQKEDDFINSMKELNAGGQADQAVDPGSDEEAFIKDLQSMNEQPADNQE